MEGNSILKEGMSAVVQSLTAAASAYDESTAKRAKDISTLTKELVSLYDLLESARNRGKPTALLERIQKSIEVTEKSIADIEK